MATNDYDIHLHHVGSFAGFPIHIPAILYPNLSLYLYDANAEGTTTVDEGNKYKKLSVIGKAIFDRVGTVDVHLTYHPAASSLFPKAKAHANYWKDEFVKSDMCDVLLTELREVRTVQVPSTTIDELCRADDVAVDFLSLDAEGSEVRILNGGQNAMKTSIVGLISEVHFATLRDGQGSAGQLFDRADELGFHMTDLRMHPGMSYKRMPLGWYDQGNVMSGDATFLKRFDAISADHPRPALSFVKLGLFSLLAHRLEHCIAAVEAALAADDQILNRGNDVGYVKLFAELMALYRTEKAIFLPVWSDFYPTAEAGFRHGDPDRGVNLDEAGRRYFARVDTPTFIQRVSELAAQGDNPLESLLKRYGFDQLAAIVNNFRQRSLVTLLNWLPLMEKEGNSNLETIAQRIARLKG